MARKCERCLKEVPVRRARWGEMEIEVYAQGKRFVAKTAEEVDRILELFKGWK